MNDLQSSHKANPATPSWQFAIKHAELAQKSIAAVEISDKKLILVQNAGELHALDGICPHAGAPLAKGGLCDDRLICPWHMAEFRVSDGAWLAPPALAGLKKYSAKIEGDDVFVDLNSGVSRSVYSVSAAVPSVVTLIGNGAASTATLCALRDFGYSGKVEIFGAHDDAPIDRTQLTKNALNEKLALDKLPLLSASQANEMQATFYQQKVVALDAQDKRFTTADGATRTYETAVFATGGEALRGTFPGAELEGVFTIRHRADLERLLAAKKTARSIVILGASFIGLEAASSLVGGVATVTVVGQESLPFEKLLGAKISKALVALHEGKGVRFELGSKIQALRGSGRVDTVALADGRELTADLVIVGFGVKPATAGVQGVELLDDGAIVVNEHLEAAPGLYAAGDVAAVRGADGKPVRIEHWRLAEQHGYAIARSIVGAREPFTSTPFFWSQQHGKRLAYVGHTESWNECIIDGEPATMDFSAYYLKDEMVVAALTCGREWVTTQLLELLKAKPTLDALRSALAQRAGMR